MATPWEEQMEEGQAAFQQRRHADAEAHFEAALDLARASDQRKHLEPATLERLGEVNAARGRRERAEEQYRQVVALREADLGPHHADLASPLFELAGLALARQDFAGAEEYYRRAEEVAAAAHGADSVDVATIRHSLGTLYVLQKEYDKAIAPLEQALAVRETNAEQDRFGPMTTRILLAECCEAEGRMEDAATHLGRVLADKRKLLGDGHRGLMGTLEQLSRIQEARGDEAAALALEEELLAIREASLGAHPATLQSLKDVARLAVTREDYGRAADCYQRLTELNPKVLASGHPSFVEDLEYLVELLDYLGRGAAADAARTQLERLRKRGR